MQELEHILIAKVTQPVDLRKLLNSKKVNKRKSENFRPAGHLMCIKGVWRCKHIGR